MYIQEIIIDGFKSYAQKTVVSGFDAQFNAITGLNGSGKSNILDAICFVLGINNLTQVRVGNLQELVYKQGQAGVTKASVTIIFNNADPATSPVGYEQHKQITVTRQVVIGGKNKYMVNGHTVQQSQVQNLFHSVQLNVNNPHFLIMQGRITKVLNMKPPEILAMIEEAAGTRMFETKKQASIKTIEKKQLKVDEITKCINEEITPTLENLRSERQDYHAWQSNNTEYERLERFCVAKDFKEAEDRVKSSEQDRANLEQQQESYLQIQVEKSNAAEDCQQQIQEISKRRDEQMDGEMKDLKKREAELSKDVVKSNSTLTHGKESIGNEQDTIKQLTQQLDSLHNVLVQKELDIAKNHAEIVVKEEELKSAEEQVQVMQRKQQDAMSGVANENTAEFLSIPQQIATWEKVDRESASKLQQLQQKHDHVKRQLQDLQKQDKKQSSSHTAIMKEMDTLKADIAKAQARLDQTKVSSKDEQHLRTNMQQASQQLQSLSDEIDHLQASVRARLAFDYSDPERGFDRANRVKGCVANLFQVKDAACTTAMEVIAGGKLYQVVIDNEQTGKLLLTKGQLKKRTTFIPLNKISRHVLSREHLQRIAEIARAQHGSANLALELISFDEVVRPAMEHIFGQVVVCSTADIAKSIAFDRNLRVRTVTLDGDVFDPSGTLTGGSKGSLGVLLSSLQTLQQKQQQFQQAKQQHQDGQRQLQQMEKRAAEQRDLESDLELKKHALSLNEEKLATTDYVQQLEQIKELEGELQQIITETAQQKELQAKAKQELKTLSKAEQNITKLREQKLRQFEEEVKQAQKALNGVQTSMRALKNKQTQLHAEKEKALKEQHAVKEQKQLAEASLHKLAQDFHHHEQQHLKLQGEYEAAKKAVQALSADLNRASKEIQSLEGVREKLKKESHEASLEARKILHQLKQWDKDFKDSQKAMQSLLKQYPWIDREKQFFGQPGTDFDFAAKDMKSCEKRLHQLKQEQERLTKKINKKVMGMIETAEAEYEDLNRKREVILNDKSKIEHVIDELDRKKIEALQKTWEQVNKDFGSIFSMLLPGTQAKLEPPEGCTVTDGLEVKVAFNHVWKESLTELSGGQRSLLALSLILALLLFKPAPMYILDEVDAALDLSHTQNIGMMIKTHFSASQFIVVSLKEGMFNNANVIFRTKFVDGVSTVTRTLAGARARGAAAAAITNGEEDEEAEPVRKKGKAQKASAGRSAVTADL